MAQAFKIPGGTNKDTPLHQAETRDIAYWMRRISSDLEQNPGKKYADRDREWLAAAKAELARRKSGGQPAGAAPSGAQRSASGAQSTALATRQTEQVVGAWHDARVIDTELRKASESMHLVSPATVCGSLPEGCEVAISLVHVDPDDSKAGPGEVYNVGGGKLGLSGVTIKRIGSAAGVDWDMERSGRLDNGREPRYCHYRAVGYVRNFDGSMRTLSGEVELDLRDDSPQVLAMKARSKTDDGFESQLRDMRLFILRHAETKAKLRAICDIGLKRSYTKDELSKPFAVARLMATGRTSDPALRAEFARMNFDKMTSGRAALYGGQAAPALPQHSAPRPDFHGHDAPPPGSVSEPPDDDGGWGGDYDTSGEEVPPSEPATQAGSAPAPVPADGDIDRGDSPEAY